jgi:transcriptional regulator GlxA family with amidase domain
MTRNVAFVLFDGAEELDWVGPWEVFTMLAQAEEGSVRCFTVSEAGDTVTCAKGLRILPDYAFATCPAPSIVVVPGGFGTIRESGNPAMLDFVRGAAAAAELTTSVCTGAFVLARAGLLTGKRATTHFGSMHHLRAIEGIEAVEERWVDEGTVITAAGVSAGIDMALHVVGRLWSPATAARVQKWMQYYPSPPHPEAALPEWSP